MHLFPLPGHKSSLEDKGQVLENKDVQNKEL